MPEFFLELFSEEIPARMQSRAADDLARLCSEALAPLSPSGARNYFGPRRIALAADVSGQVAASNTVERGPRANAQEQALAGFLLMWPLYTVKNCASSTPEQLAVVKLALQRIGNVMGIRQALVMHDNGELPRPEKTLQIPQMAVG